MLEFSIPFHRVLLKYSIWLPKFNSCFFLTGDSVLKALLQRCPEIKKLRLEKFTIRWVDFKLDCFKRLTEIKFQFPFDPYVRHCLGFIGRCFLKLLNRLFYRSAGTIHFHQNFSLRSCIKFTFWAATWKIPYLGFCLNFAF